MIELLSPYTSVSIRNKLIAEAFYLTKNIEKYGSGFIRIRKDLESYPNVSFDVEETGGYYINE
jgi:ATP-dependent DNA helicase RecG